MYNNRFVIMSLFLCTFAISEEKVKLSRKKETSSRLRENNFMLLKRDQVWDPCDPFLTKLLSTIFYCHWYNSYALYCTCQLINVITFSFFMVDCLRGTNFTGFSFKNGKRFLMSDFVITEKFRFVSTFSGRGRWNSKKCNQQD